MTVDINLLPWREQRRELRQQQFFVALGVAVFITGLLMFTVHLMVSNKIARQESRNAFLEQEIAILDKRIEAIKALKKTRAALIARMEVIQSLQASRPQIVHFFDELVQVLPKGVYLTTLKRRGTQVTLQGFADSNSSVSTLMRNISRAEWLGDAQLIEIKKQPQTGARTSEFTLVLHMKNPTTKLRTL